MDDQNLVRQARALGATSPFSAAFEVPLEVDLPAGFVGERWQGQWSIFGGYMAFSLIMTGMLLATMVWMFNSRWRVAES